jgi:hypothetical protein
MRLPDFLVIGAMKGGTTSLYRWLELSGLAALPTIKEPNFFTDGWNRGLEWYSSLFAHLNSSLITGEASVGYSDPIHGDLVAQRIHQTVPQARLVFVARHPVERLRSHYRHDVQRNREPRSFAEAASDPTSTYIRRSLYAKALKPYFDRFDPDQIIVASFTDLTEGDGFGQILHRLGLPAVPRPDDAFNVTGSKRQYTPLGRWLFEHGLSRSLGGAPAPIKGVGRWLGTRTNLRYQFAMTESHTAEMPRKTLDVLAADASEFERLTGLSFGWAFPG